MGNKIRMTLRGKKANDKKKIKGKKKMNIYFLSIFIFFIITSVGCISVNNAMSDLLVMDKNPKIKISFYPFEISVKTRNYYIYVNEEVTNKYFNFMDKIFSSIGF